MENKSIQEVIETARKISSRRLLQIAGDVIAKQEGCKVGEEDDEIHFSRKNRHFVAKAFRPNELKRNTRKSILGLCEQNMRKMYEQTPGGWNIRSKETELFDNSSRFILVYERGTETEVAALVIWQFDQEFCDQNDPVARKDEEEIEVLYCFELQVHSKYQRFGLGRTLMEMLERIATHTQMRKVMLTVFHSNTSARDFYARLDFRLEYSTEDRDETDEEVDELGEYVILSKSIKLGGKV